MWVDDTFPATTSSMFFDAKELEEEIHWKRPQDLSTNSVLAKMDNYSLPMQGNLGNCWLICAFYALAKSETVWNKVFEFCEFDISNSDYKGKIIIQLWVNGVWEKITIDDRLPTIYKDGQYKLINGSCNDSSQFWAPLLEKACAKLYGCYESLISGRVSEGFLLVTGGYTWCEEVSNGITKMEYLLARIKLINKSRNKYGTQDSNVFVSCDKALTTDTKNILTQELHCYALVELDDTNIGSIKVKIWNPWQSSSGAKSSNSCVNVFLEDLIEFRPRVTYTTTDLNCILNVSNQLIYQNFISEKLVYGEWRALCTSGGTRQSNTFHENPQIYISLKNNSNIHGILHVTLFQVSKRNSSKRKFLEQAIGLHIFNADSKPSCRLSLQQINSLNSIFSTKPEYEYSQNRSSLVSFQFNDNAPNHFILVPSTFSTNINCNFLLRIISCSSIDECKVLS
ncbi:calpain-10-like [Styela clava]